MRKLLSVFAAATLLASVSAHAQKSGTSNASAYHYKWYDGQGQMHFSDSLTADAMKFGYDVVNAQGLAIQHVARQLNPEERAAANKLAAEQAAQQHAAQERANAEAQMLSAYPDEESFKISQQQALDTIDQQIHTIQGNLRSQEKALTDLLTRAADIERAKGPVPKFLVDSISTQRNVVTGQRNSLERLQAQRAQTVQVQATELVRYRQLKAAQEQPAQ
jgi:pyruvate/2-oxoglutarate dehydrogenase complex dihydrolipoamide acyltransferase (E2) component